MIAAEPDITRLLARAETDEVDSPSIATVTIDAWC